MRMIDTASSCRTRIGIEDTVRVQKVMAAVLVELLVLSSGGA